MCVHQVRMLQLIHHTLCMCTNTFSLNFQYSKFAAHLHDYDSDTTTPLPTSQCVIMAAAISVCDFRNLLRLHAKV